MVEIEIKGDEIWGFINKNGERYGRGGIWKGRIETEEDALYVVDRLRNAFNG